MPQHFGKKYLYGVILAGGSGSRLWPMSRETYPKHLLSLIGDQSLLQATVSRIEKLIPPSSVFFVTNNEHALQIKTQLNFFKNGEKADPENSEHFILEPIGRNTAPAIGLAAFRLFALNPDSVMISMPSDHLIKETDKFLELIKYSIKIALKGYLVTFGITPHYPETGYGYIKNSELLDEENVFKAYLADSFNEKPDIELAKKYLESGGYFWNSGIFVWKTKEILRSIKAYQPELFKKLAMVSGLAEEDQKFKKTYESIKSIDIDRGILEKSDRVAIIPTGDVGWSDVGTWDKIHQALPKDDRGNYADKRVIQIDCENSLFYGNKRVIGAISLKDIIVVDTDDALLICNKDKSQQVKEIFERLKNEGGSEYLHPKTVVRPWGNWSALLEGPGYKIKKIVVLPGQKLSLQQHQFRSEHWVVVNGVAQVTNSTASYLIEKNQSAFIPPNCRHRLENPSQTHDLEIIEIQNGEYLGEDDIIRFDDIYER